VEVDSLSGLWYSTSDRRQQGQAEEAKADTPESAGLRVSHTGLILQRKFTVTSNNRGGHVKKYFFLKLEINEKIIFDIK
jgi:hypothetical protein